MPIIYKYPLPPVLAGVFDVSRYAKFLNCKADTLRKRDLRLGRPCADKNSKAAYKAKIHAAFLDAGRKDPYTGDDLLWDLVGKWDNKKAEGDASAYTPSSASKGRPKGYGGKKDEIIRAIIGGASWERIARKALGLLKKPDGVYGAFNRDFFLLPTVDHSDPSGNELKFEICSWIVNSSKTIMTSEEFIGFCKKITRYRSGK